MSTIDITVCDGETVRVPAGNRYRFAWPLIVAAPATKDDLDVLVLITPIEGDEPSGDTTTDVPTLTEGADAQHLTIGQEIEFPDTAEGRYRVACDIDDQVGDLARQQFDVIVEPATAQRPTGS